MEKVRMATSFRLSDVAIALLTRIADHSGIDRTSALEILIREKADSMGIKRPDASDQAGKRRGRAART
jgi:hypothetical protein